MTSPILIAGNWKMNGVNSSLSAVEQIGRLCSHLPAAVEVALFPPSTLLAVSAILIRETPLLLGGQDCSSEASGAFTGEISAGMLKDAGASFAMIGHSERRQRHGETDDLVRQKAIRAIEAGLKTVICIGETNRERDDGKTLDVLTQQLARSVPRVSSSNSIVIAYEPTWAIGTGRTPTTEEIADVHHHIRSQLIEQWGEGGRQIRIIYGGSVKASNAADILSIAQVDGLLVGGASLDVKQFAAICEHGQSVKAAAA